MAESLGQIPCGTTFKGQDIEDVPTWYLKWFKGEKGLQDKYPELTKNIIKELEYRKRFGDPE